MDLRLLHRLQPQSDTSTFPLQPMYEHPEEHHFFGTRETWKQDWLLIPSFRKIGARSRMWTSLSLVFVNFSYVMSNDGVQLRTINWFTSNWFSPSALNRTGKREFKFEYQGCDVLGRLCIVHSTTWPFVRIYISSEQGHLLDKSRSWEMLWQL